MRFFLNLVLCAALFRSFHFFRYEHFKESIFANVLYVYALYVIYPLQGKHLFWLLHWICY